MEEVFDISIVRGHFVRRRTGGMNHNFMMA